MTVVDILDYRTWKPVAITGIAAIVILGVAFGAGYWQGQKKVQAVQTQAETQANIAKGEHDALKRQAQAKDQEIAAKESSLDVARASVRRAEQELARLKMGRDTVVPVPVSPIPSTPMGDMGMEAHGSDLFGRQEAVILAQSNLIKLQDAKIESLTISRDAWKASAEAGEREAAGLRIALESQKSLTKGALWKGRIQGLAIGLGTGYVAGRLQR